ncbi:MAG: serine/threonine-protein kinase [Planctomycetota bacterium]
MPAPDAPSDDVPSRFHVDFQGRTLLGTYRVDRRLAEGGMGAVYLAHDQNLGRRVVVKVPHVRFLAEPGFRARFRREITELVRLEHPSIVRILAQGEEDEVPFFVLQYLGGGSLEDRIARGPTPPEQVLPWLQRVAETLDYVHGQGVVHRDVKPGNILFDEQGHVFLSDFGVVKALEPDADGPELTEAGTGVGSPVYMAPEQALGQPTGPSADQYALASTVYEALVGEPPFGRGSAVEVVVRKARGAAPSAREKCPSLPEACAAAIARALSTDPAQRFPWCAAFVEAFRAGLASAPTQAFVPVPRRSTAFVGLFAAVGLVVAAGLAYLGLRPRAADPAASGAAAVDETPGVLVRLAKPGAEPRARLRVAPPVGSTSALALGLMQSMTRSVEGLPDATTTSRVTQDVDATVAGVSAEGATLDWRLAVPAFEATADADVERVHRAIAALGRGLGTSVLTPRGVATRLALRYDGAADVPPEARGGLDEMVRLLALALPAEPVGPGAEWDATALLEVGGVRYQETLSCRLVARDGDRVTIAGEVQYASPSQHMVGPRAEGVREIELTSIEGSGRIRVEWDLARPLPSSMTTDGTLSFTASATAEGVSRKIRFTKRYETEAKPR